MTTIPMVTHDATPHVMRAFKMTGPTQMFRELPVNAAQAGATTLRMGTAFSIVRETGVHYATFEDDGEGMSPSDMPDFLNTFGGSGRTIGETDDNFGIGFKTSAIPDNKRGVVILSLRDGVTSMMWVWVDPVTDQIGARVLCNPDLLGDEYLDSVSQSGSPSVLVLDDNGDAWEEVVIDGIDWTKVMPQWIEDAGHGTCFVMLGNDGTDTVGKVGGLTQKYGGIKEITRRFWTLPLQTIVQTSYENFENRASWPTRQEDCGSDRKAEGAQDFLLDAAEAVGTMELTDTMSATLTWVLMNDGGDRRRGSQRGDRISWPATAALYESHQDIIELMDLKSGNDARDRIDQFVGPHAVAKRVMIFVEPRGNVWQDGTRTVLRWLDANSSTPKGLPWADWAREFRANQPEEIAALVRDHYAGISEGADDLTDEDYQRLGSRFAAYLKRFVQVLRPNPDGAMQAGPTSQSTVGRARRGPRRNSTTGPHDPQPSDQATRGDGQTASLARRVQELPQVRLDADQFNDRDWAACHYDDIGHIVYVNPNHLYVKALDRALQDKYGDESAERRDLAVQGGRRAIKSHASLVVAHQLQLAQSWPAMHPELMSDIALTSAFGGVRNLMEVASGYVGDLMRRAS